MNLTHAERPVRPFSVTHGEVLRISIPMTLAFLSTPLTGLIATGVIGQLQDEAATGGVALASVVFDVIFVTFNFLRGATTAFTAQAMGAGNRAEEQRMLAAALSIALIAGFVLLLFQVPLGALGLSLMGSQGHVDEMAKTYFHWRIWSAPFVLFNYVAFGWVIGRGNSFAGLVLQILLNGLNAGLSLAFVTGFGWGIEGVALATLIAEAATALAGLWLIITGTQKSAWRLPDRAALKRSFAVNGDMMIRTFALLIGLSFFTRQSGVLGLQPLAANTILLHYYFFGVGFLDGVATAAEQLAGRSVGARYRPAFDQTVRLTTLWGFVFAFVVAAAFALTGGTVISWTAPSAAVADLAHTFLPYVVALPITGTLAFQMDGIYIGATWSRQMRNLMLISLAIYFAAWAILQPMLGNHGLWIALLIFQSARSIAFRLLLPRLVERTFA